MTHTPLRIMSTNPIDWFWAILAIVVVGLVAYNLLRK